ncbi:MULTISPECIES: hypoxanthine phosphoribosyltransferase [Calditerrivibrio]|uniref:Hypoxanthine phosphoribosyltransferase n=1 Tax=Calditerrivibrio nitroreducens TaxID=477976 RepID=A0A2J6WHR6_9BACT|nr:MAG: hypoxanthine phosphoribosyltransferase [Calditerrivibrio nitroreducens]
MEKHTLEVLISYDQIIERVKLLAETITKDFEGEDLLVVGVLKGAWIFMADLVKYIDLPMEISFVSVSSYAGERTTSSGVVRLLCDVDRPVEKRNVILVEDIIDTGLTINYLKRLFSVRNPNSLKICSLLDKPSRRLADINPDYCGFSIPDKFVVGYGLDYNGYYRNLKDISILKINA